MAFAAGYLPLIVVHAGRTLGPPRPPARVCLFDLGGIALIAMAALAPAPRTSLWAHPGRGPLTRAAGVARRW
ncbi:hypothetical protein GCM10022252_30000 [Streptosporangium oxazolinicum]|uniref:Uncharacterized protein n=1 Tax=Streptosporangium oxazolinicum TaxID=909287 RepID=A0ABP8AV73_9ACTN